MTVAVVMVDGDRVVMAADSVAVGGPDMTNRRHPPIRKVHRVQVPGAPAGRRGTALIAGAGSVAGLELGRWTAPPKVNGDLDEWAWRYVKVLRDAAHARGLVENDDDEDKVLDCHWLVAFRGAAWHVTEDVAMRTAVQAIGTGGPYALGALAVLRAREPAWAAEQLLGAAVVVACEHDAACGPPVTVEVL